MAARDDELIEALAKTFGDRLAGASAALGEVTAVFDAKSWRQAAETLRDADDFRFEQLVDLAGVDYLEYADGVALSGRRYAVVFHLLSLSRNQRLRARVFCSDDDLPVVDSISAVWPSAMWYEREAFDLYGIVFEGHPDLRRILTDYGFIGHPFRKDFPLSGNVEMRYDADQGRVIYQPVTIEPRNNVPRIVREETYGDTGG